MITLVKKLGTFLASPDDVSEERKIVRGLIDEFNDYYSELNYMLEFMGWEVCPPGMGRAQNILNKLIDRCEIFIGIMGSRFGTPTGEADSGTEEEFRHAYKLWYVNGAPQILFYFKNIKDNPDIQKDEQYQKVIQFKTELKKTGLIKEYNDLDDFKQQVKTHLKKIVSDIMTRENFIKMADEKLEVYVDLLKNRNPLERKRAAQILGSIKDVRAVKPLIEALNDDIEVKLEIIDALGNIGDKRAIESLLVLVKDYNTNIRQKTIDALNKIDPSFLKPQIPIEEINNHDYKDPINDFRYSIKLSPTVSTQLTGGETSIIIAQLYYDQTPIKLQGIPVTFSIDNSNVASLHKITTYITDINGQAAIPLTSHNCPGIVKIIAKSIINDRIIQDSTEVNIVLWGTIVGTIYDQNGVSIPNANVTLWNWTRNNLTGFMERTSLVRILENPQISNDGRTAHVGRYCYYRVPSGDYCVTAEKEGHFYYTIIHLEEGTVSQDVVVTGFNFIPLNFDKPKPKNKLIQLLLKPIEK